MTSKSKGGRPRLDPALKRARGTLRPHRERAHVISTSGLDGPTADRDYLQVAADYARDVRAGRIVAGSWARKAAARFEKMHARADKPTAPYRFDPDHVRAVCAFVERLPHVEGRWSTETIVLQPWQIFILAGCYGFRRLDGGRLVTTVFFEVARKSAKSTLVAACALYHLAVEREPGAQVICAASTGSQARLVFSIMQRMVRRAAWLRDGGLQAFANAITLEDIGGTARPINSKSSTQDGLNPSFISLDESHAQTFELRDVLVSAMGARAEGMVWCPTTAGYDLTSVGFALRSSAMKILDGVVESDHTFCILYEPDEGDDWRHEDSWRKSAPMLGISPTLDFVQRYCQDAQATPGMEAEFQTKILNRWLQSASSWLSMAAWNRCADTALTLDAFDGAPCWIGVDLAERDDIAAVALCFQRDGMITGFVRGYLPARVVADRARAVPEYQAWVRSGELVTTDGDLTDYGVIEADLRADCERFDVQAIVIERFGALHLASNLLTSGLPARVESKNPKVFTPPARELEARVRAGKFRHAGTSFLTWQASNVCVSRRRDGSLLPTKESAESPNKIDAIDALLLGLSAVIEAPMAAEPTYQVMVFGDSRW